MKDVSQFSTDLRNNSILNPRIPKFHPGVKVSNNFHFLNKYDNLKASILNKSRRLGKGGKRTRKTRKHFKKTRKQKNA